MVKNVSLERKVWVQIPPVMPGKSVPLFLYASVSSSVKEDNKGTSFRELECPEFLVPMPPPHTHYVPVTVSSGDTGREITSNTGEAFIFPVMFQVFLLKLFQ